jgi:acyl-CoA thioesterase FadM
MTVQYRHDARFRAAAADSDEVEIVSRLVEVRRVRGTWCHEIWQTRVNVLVLRDYSTGAFLDWHGKIRTPPAQMMERLILGEDSMGDQTP